MPIPESQLQTWSHQGAETTAATTHESIRFALLEANTSRVKDKDVRCFLQGSYKNTTNIRGDSDVDLVVQSNRTYYSDLSSLTTSELERYQASRIPATYEFTHLREDVLASLRSYYGPYEVTPGNKSLKLKGGTGRLPADVVPAFQYRKYLSFPSVNGAKFVEGIVFFTAKDQRKVVNYPGVHYDNGVSKNARVSQRYKPTVRMFKNARNRLEEQGRIPDNMAPSYFVECLLYNVPDQCFHSSFQQTYAAVVNHLHQADMSRYLCQNEQLPLFGNTPEQWSLNEAQKLVSELVWLWGNWY